MHFSRTVTFLFKKEVKPKIEFTQHLILCCFKGTQMFLRRMKKMQRGSSLITWNKYQEQLWDRRVLSYVGLSRIYETRLAMAGKSTHLLIHSSIHSCITGHLDTYHAGDVGLAIVWTMVSKTRQAHSAETSWALVKERWIKESYGLMARECTKDPGQTERLCV